MKEYLMNIETGVIYPIDEVNWSTVGEFGWVRLQEMKSIHGGNNHNPKDVKILGQDEVKKKYPLLGALLGYPFASVVNINAFAIARSDMVGAFQIESKLKSMVLDDFIKKCSVKPPKN